MSDPASVKQPISGAALNITCQSDPKPAQAQVSRFLGLPRELRLRIYSYSKREREWDDTRKKLIDPLRLCWLRTCKFMYEDARELLPLHRSQIGITNIEERDRRFSSAGGIRVQERNGVQYLTAFGTTPEIYEYISGQRRKRAGLDQLLDMWWYIGHAMVNAEVDIVVEESVGFLGMVETHLRSGSTAAALEWYLYQYSQWAMEHPKLRFRVVMVFSKYVEWVAQAMDQPLAALHYLHEQGGLPGNLFLKVIGIEEWIARLEGPRQGGDRINLTDASLAMLLTSLKEFRDAVMSL